MVAKDGVGVDEGRRERGGISGEQGGEKIAREVVVVHGGKNIDKNVDGLDHSASSMGRDQQLPRDGFAETESNVRHVTVSTASLLKADRRAGRGFLDTSSDSDEDLCHAEILAKLDREQERHDGATDPRSAEEVDLYFEARRVLKKFLKRKEGRGRAPGEKFGGSFDPAGPDGAGRGGAPVAVGTTSAGGARGRIAVGVGKANDGHGERAADGTFSSGPGPAPDGVAPSPADPAALEKRILALLKRTGDFQFNFAKHRPKTTDGVLDVSKNGVNVVNQSDSLEQGVFRPAVAVPPGLTAPDVLTCHLDTRSLEPELRQLGGEVYGEDFQSVHHIQ